MKLFKKETKMKPCTSALLVSIDPDGFEPMISSVQLQYVSLV